MLIMPVITWIVSFIAIEHYDTSDDVVGMREPAPVFPYFFTLPRSHFRADGRVLLCASADVITKANYFFTAIFTLEAVLKITGQGWQVYIRNLWNKFDFFIVVVGVFDVVLSSFESSFTKVVNIFQIQKILRLLRISRMIKLIKGLKARPFMRPSP